MKNKNKALMLVLSVALIVVASVFSTLAYLTDTDDATNTFTVGNVYIELDEVNYDQKDAEGKDNSTETRDTANEYHLLPGQTYEKDPTVTVLKDSEESYVRMIVTVKNIDQLKAALPQKDENGDPIAANAEYYGDGDVFLLQMLCNGWESETWVYNNYSETKTDENYTDTDGSEQTRTVQNGVYEFRYKTKVAKSEENNTVLDALFDSITVPSEINNDGIAHLADVEINVAAHAIQAVGFGDADAAWTAFDAQQ